MAKANPKPWEGTWRTLRKLGTGGHGKASLVERHDEPGEQFALKELSRQDDIERRQRMHREVQALRLLQHSAIPRVVETNSDLYADLEIPLYFVMDYVEGPTLEERVNQGHLRPNDAVVLTIEIADTLIFCHQNGLIHRDIKPDNVILRAGNINEPVLIDFGQSFNKEDTEQFLRTPDGQQMGNRFLHLPELQIGESRKQYFESDISQVCGALFYALTGKMPVHLVDHEGLKPHQRAAAKVILDKIPSPSLYPLFDKGFEHEFAKRFRSFQAFKGRLHEVLDDLKHSSDATDQNGATVTLETITPEIKTALSQGPKQESPQHGSAEAEKPKSNAAQRVYLEGEADALVFASLLGAWNEKSEGDRDAIKDLIEGHD
jgi:eukaryotic-like serine/threonine-protein kinase